MARNKSQDLLDPRFFLISLCLLLAWTATACGQKPHATAILTRLAVTPSPAASLTARPTMVQPTPQPLTPASTASLTPRPTATHIVYPTWTNTLPPTTTGTPTGVPPPPAALHWFTRNLVIQAWPTNIYSSLIKWESDNSIEIKSGYVYEYPRLSIAPDGSKPVEFSPTGTPFHNADPNEYNLFYSPEGTYMVECGPVDNQNLYHGLKLYRVLDDHLIGEVEGAVTPCTWAISWAKDESIFSYIDFDTEQVYAWKPDRSAPYAIGDLGWAPEPGTWSPDSKRLAVEIPDLQSEDPNAIDTYIIFYTNGLPPLAPGTQIYPGHSMPGIGWLTNEIIYSTGSAVSCISYDYFVANTGEELPNMSWSDCGPYEQIPPQKPILAPDQRWVVIDQTKQNPFALASIVQSFIYTLYDLRNKRGYELSNTTDTFLDFVGWTMDNSQFLLIRRPVSETVGVQPDTTYGLLSLNPATQQLNSIALDIRYAWLSPDGKHFFGLTGTENPLLGAVYALDGTRLTQPTPLQVLDPWAAPASPGPVWVVWSPDSRRVAYRDMSLGLWVAGVDGSLRQLAAGLPLPESWPYDPGMVWSSDGSGILILGGAWAWSVYPPLVPGQPVSLNHLDMLDAANGWAQTISGHLVRTMDGGKTWVDVTPMDTALFYDQDAVTAWAASIDGASAWETTDGGQTWLSSKKNQAEINMSWHTWPEFGAYYFNNDLGWRIAAGQLQHTQDGGKTWVSLKIVAWESAQFSFVDESDGWAIVTDQESSTLVDTTDGGFTWEAVNAVVGK